MKKLLLIILFYIGLFATEYEVDERLFDDKTSILFLQDEDGKTNPKVEVLLIYWNDSLYSAIGYLRTSTTETGTVSHFDDSKKSTSIDTTTLDLKVLAFVTKIAFDMDFEMAYDISFINIDKNEFGYIHDDANQFQVNQEWIAFDNEINIDVQSHILKTALSKIFADSFSIKVECGFTPYSMLSVKQNTLFKPLSSEEGKTEGTKKQKFSYNYSIDLTQKVSDFFSVKFNYSYDLLPLKYDLAILTNNADNTGYDFKTIGLNTQIETTSYSFSIVLPYKIIGNLNPSIGFSRIKEKTVNLDDSSNDTTTKDVILFGLDTTF